MSAATAPAGGVPGVPLIAPTAPSRGGARGWLRLVPQRRSEAPTTPFALVLVVLLGGGLLGLLLLNTMVAQGSFTLHDLAAKAKDLQQREQQLTAQVQAFEAPGDLASRATQLGMVPGGPPAFLRLSDGQVLGTALPGAAQPKPSPTVSPSPAGHRAAPPAPSGSTTWTAPRPSPAPAPGGRG